MPLRSIQPLLNMAHADSHELLLAETPNGGITNAFFCGVPGSALLRRFTETLPAYSLGAGGKVPKQLLRDASILRPAPVDKDWTDWGGCWAAGTLGFPHMQVMMSTGPTRFWKHMGSVGGLYAKDQDRVATVKSSEWGRCSLCSHSCDPEPGAFFAHLQGSSWHQWDSAVFNALPCLFGFDLQGSSSLDTAVFWAAALGFILFTALERANTEWSNTFAPRESTSFRFWPRCLVPCESQQLQAFAVAFRSWIFRGSRKVRKFACFLCDPEPEWHAECVV
jgi:hypothetical protein